jgi:predicted GNAT family acetyltransferase
MEISVTNDEQGRQFHAEVDGHRAHLDYVRHADGTLDLVHTEVDPALRGQGVGEAVVRFAMDAARSGGFKVIPTCPFVKKFVERHPEYEDVVTHRASAL